jgi:HSP20 family protein
MKFAEEQQMNLINWTPFRELDSFFDRYARELSLPRAALSSSEMQWKPAATITENEKEYTIKADLPEVQRKDIDIKVENGVLTIKGERRVEKSSEDEIEHRREVFHGLFSRSFSLPEDVDAAAIVANSKDGVLTVHLPKVKEERAKALSIEVT